MRLRQFIQRLTGAAISRISDTLPNGPSTSLSEAYFVFGLLPPQGYLLVIPSGNRPLLGFGLVDAAPSPGGQPYNFVGKLNRYHLPRPLQTENMPRIL